MKLEEGPAGQHEHDAQKQPLSTAGSSESLPANHSSLGHITANPSGCDAPGSSMGASPTLLALCSPHALQRHMLAQIKVLLADMLSPSLLMQTGTPTAAPCSRRLRALQATPPARAACVARCCRCRMCR